MEAFDTPVVYTIVSDKVKLVYEKISDGLSLPDIPILYVYSDKNIFPYNPNTNVWYGMHIKKRKGLGYRYRFKIKLTKLLAESFKSKSKKWEITLHISGQINDQRLNIPVVKCVDIKELQDQA